MKKIKEQKSSVGGMILNEQLNDIFQEKMNAYEKIDFTKNKYHQIRKEIEVLVNKFCHHINKDMEIIAKEEAYQKSLQEPEELKEQSKYPLYTFEHGDSEDNWYPKLVEITDPEDIYWKMQAFWYEYVNDFDFTEEEYAFYKKHFNTYYYWEIPEEDIKEYNHSIINVFNQIEPNNTSWDNKEYREYFRKYAHFDKNNRFKKIKNPEGTV